MLSVLEVVEAHEGCTRLGLSILTVSLASWSVAAAVLTVPARSLLYHRSLLLADGCFTHFIPQFRLLMQIW